MTKATLILSDVSIVPVGPSLADIWATSDFLSTIRLAKELKPSVNVKIIWNKFRASTTSAQALSESAKEELGLKTFTNALGYRVAYIDAYGEGLTVLEWRDKNARNEMKMLSAELEGILKSNINVNRS